MVRIGRVSARDTNIYLVAWATGRSLPYLIGSYVMGSTCGSEAVVSVDQGGSP